MNRAIEVQEGDLLVQGHMGSRFDFQVCTLKPDAIEGSEETVLGVQLERDTWVGLRDKGMQIRASGQGSAPPPPNQ